MCVRSATKNNSIVLRVIVPASRFIVLITTRVGVSIFLCFFSRVVLLPLSIIMHTIHHAIAHISLHSLLTYFFFHPPPTFSPFFLSFTFIAYYTEYYAEYYAEYFNSALLQVHDIEYHPENFNSRFNPNNGEGASF